MIEGISTISFSDWQRLDLRVGKITAVDSIEGADKLYKLSIDLGKEIGKRTLAAGLKPYYKPSELKNKLCVIFTNLQPRMLKGVESQGMLLAAVSPDEKEVHLLQPDSDIEVGSKIR
jgi:methionyl-tRNA synthetase